MADSGLHPRVSSPLFALGAFNILHLTPPSPFARKNDRTLLPSSSVYPRKRGTWVQVTDEISCYTAIVYGTPIQVTDVPDIRFAA